MMRWADRIIGKKYCYILIAIFIFGLCIRFINFKESLYFGYDEARDAYDSQDIYLKGDLKLSGPPASAFKGINHGPLYLYILGPLFILDSGNPYLASSVFRIINALGIIIVAVIVSIYFNRGAGLVAALLYAVSFEQHQYAIFTGNPALSNVFWLIIFLGAGMVYKYNEKTKSGILLMLLGASFITQFDLILSYSFLTVLVLLIILRKHLKKINLKSWLIILVVGLSPLYSYPLAEIKNNFLGIKTLYSVIFGGATLLGGGGSLAQIILRNIGGLVNDNVISFGPNIFVSVLVLIILIGNLIVMRKNKPQGVFVIVWIISIFALLLTRGFMPYYSYAGIGIGVIIAAGVLLFEIFKKSRITFAIIITLIVLLNLSRINLQSQKGLVVEIKAQPAMLLSDELKIIKKSYEFAAFDAFTIRTTSMPYKIQTVWSYLFNQYGLKKYGYLPYNEQGNIMGYPGYLPVPVTGTTCVRILIREPIRGIPQHLINKDIEEENLFSKVVKEENIGEFVVQFRKSISGDCHSQKPS